MDAYSYILSGQPAADLANEVHAYNCKLHSYGNKCHIFVVAMNSLDIHPYIGNILVEKSV